MDMEFSNSNHFATNLPAELSLISSGTASGMRVSSIMFGVDLGYPIADRYWAREATLHLNAKQRTYRKRLMQRNHVAQPSFEIITLE